MTSTSNLKVIAVDDDDEEQEFQHFDDFTLASSWERFISEIEAVCRQWLADGPKNLLVKDAVSNPSKDMYKTKSEFKYAKQSYFMEYYFATSNDGVITPHSASGVVLSAPEASKLLSAVAIALSNCSWGSGMGEFLSVHQINMVKLVGVYSTKLLKIIGQGILRDFMN
ncbi:hypothetical protein OROMI_006814 [Orobanche minor]